MTLDPTAELKGRAEGGEAEAQFKLGQVFNYGLGTAIDEAAAIEWYHRAADQRFEHAMFTLGEICKEGRITPQDLVQSHVWYALVVAAGGVLAAAGGEGCVEIEPYMSPEQIAEAKSRAQTWRPGGG